MGTSLIGNRTHLGPYSRTMPRALWGAYGDGRFLMSEVPLYGACHGLTTKKETLLHAKV